MTFGIRTRLCPNIGRRHKNLLTLMSDPALHEIASAIAAVVSAIGGCAAAVAALRSASSARDAARSAEDTARRAALREVSTTASNILLEVARLRTRAVELRTEYQTASAFSGSFAHSGYEELRSNAAASATSAGPYADDAALFTGGAMNLAQAPSDEVDRVLLRLTESLATARTMRDDLDRKYAEASARNAEERARRLAAQFAR